MRYEDGLMTFVYGSMNERLKNLLSARDMEFSELSDEALLALLLGGSNPSDEKLKLARRVIESAGGVSGFSDIDFAELCKLRGVGPATASRVLAAVELGSRVLCRKTGGEKINSSRKVFEHLYPLFARESVEVFVCVLLDAKLRIITSREISRGTLTASLVHPRDAFKEAVRKSASGVIFVHNHPSGDAEPSLEDVRITRRLSDVGELLGIPVLDHIIIGGASSYYSFADSGEIKAAEIQGSRGVFLR